MKNPPIEKGVWYVTTEGRKRSLAYCWKGGDRWVVVSWGGSFNTYPLKQVCGFRNFVKTDLVRDVGRSRDDTYADLCRWRQENLPAECQVEPVTPPTDPPPKPEPAKFVLAYMGSRLEPVTYLHECSFDGQMQQHWVAEPRLATPFTEENAMLMLRTKLGRVEEFGSFTIPWALVRLLEAPLATSP